MRRNNVEGWKELAYSLFYPGVLGSMIFDVLDPLRSRSWTMLALICIALAFATDFLHMVVDLEARKKETSKWWLDVIIAGIFCGSYFFLAHTTKALETGVEGSKQPVSHYGFSFSVVAVNHLDGGPASNGPVGIGAGGTTAPVEYYLCSLFLLAAAHFLVVWYEVPIRELRKKWRRELTRLMPTCICLLGFSVAWISAAIKAPEGMLVCVAIAVSLLSWLAYVFYVFCVWDREKTRVTM
jgi:hypothetical protein